MLESQHSRYGAIARSIPMMNPISKVFFAIHSAAEHVSSSASGWLANFQNEFPEDKDGVARVHSTIQAAIDATTTGRGDIVFVSPGKWKEEVKVISKIGVRIFGPMAAGLGWDGARLRPSDAATHYGFTTKLSNANTGACFHVMSKGVEIAGFYLDGGGGYCGIYAGGGLNGGVTGYTTENASGLYIHDNFFRGGAEGVTGLYLNGPRFGVKVENNYFERWTAAVEIDAGNANTENALIKNNTFAARNAGYGVITYGEANVKTTVIKDNVFADGVSAAYTYAIKNSDSASGVMSVVGNYFPCNIKTYLQSSDYTAGNYYGQAGSTTEDSNYFVSELTAGT